MGFEKVIEAVISVFIIVIFIGAFMPVLSEISGWSAAIFLISSILIIATIILSLMKR